MKLKIKFENIFVVLSILFIFGCFVFYGFRLVKYYRIFNPKTEAGEKTEVLSATVRKNNPVIMNGDGLYIYNGDFIFKGADVDNYVSYNSKIWRIVKVNKSGEVKLVLDESLDEIAYDSSNNSYDKSEIYNYIKEPKKLNINTDGLEKMTICLDDIDDINQITCEKMISEYMSLLSVSDYANSVNSSNESYIESSTPIWLYNKTSEGLVWTINKGMLVPTDYEYEFSLKPVILLKGSAYSSSGDGTKNNPYVVKDGE